jgi:hypothetical protein
MSGQRPPMIRESPVGCAACYGCREIRRWNFTVLRAGDFSFSAPDCRDFAEDKGEIR